jgi:hypothetical protein
MPIRSKAQERLMYAALKDPKGTGIPRSVAEKFVGPKAHAEGGIMKKESPAMVKKELAFMKAKKAPPSMIRHEKAEAKGKTKKMSSGGYTRAADGVTKHGKTKGTMVKMMGGGSC